MSDIIKQLQEAIATPKTTFLGGFYKVSLDSNYAYGQAHRVDYRAMLDKLACIAIVLQDIPDYLQDYNISNGILRYKVLRLETLENSSYDMRECAENYLSTLERTRKHCRALSISCHDFHGIGGDFKRNNLGFYNDLLVCFDYVYCAEFTKPLADNLERYFDLTEIKENLALC